MTDYSTAGSNRPRRRPSSATPVPRGLFAGNKSVKYGLVAVLACMLVASFWGRPDRHLTGPIDDVFLRDPSSLLIVYGTSGDNPDGLRDYAHKVGRLLGKSLEQDILVYPDREVDRHLMYNSTLMLYGTVGGNRVTRRLSGDFPVELSADTVRLGGIAVGGSDWRLVFAAPNPRNEDRYVLVYTGASDTDIIGINMLGDANFVRHDTTDYVLAVGSRIARSGFFVKDDPDHWTLPR